MTEEIVRLATEAIENQFAYYSGDVVLDAKTFYVPVLRLVAENERLREALGVIAERDELLDANEQAFGAPAARRMQSQARAALFGSKEADHG